MLGVQVMLVGGLEHRSAPYYSVVLAIRPRACTSATILSLPRMIRCSPFPPEARVALFQYLLQTCWTLKILSHYTRKDIQWLRLEHSSIIRRQEREERERNGRKGLPEKRSGVNWWSFSRVKRTPISSPSPSTTLRREWIRS